MVNVHQYWIYILSNYTRSTLYVGVTNDLYRRYHEHKNGEIEGFTRNYQCHYLLYYEEYSQVEEAIAREKQLKGWTRKKKENLIRTMNPDLKDLSEELNWWNVLLVDPLFAFGSTKPLLILSLRYSRLRSGWQMLCSGWTMLCYQWRFLFDIISVR